MGQKLLEKERKKSSIRFSEIPIEGYEKIYRVEDAESGLHAIIAIHNTALGPALGGTRIYPYASEKEALFDVLRLSKGMTYKSAVSGVGFGGGKSVILANPKTEKTPEKLRAFGRAVDMLQGKYICAEDVGCTTKDVEVIREETQYVVGLIRPGSSGDPGPFTAWGTFRGIQSVAKKLYGSECLEGKKIALQGLGNVGGNLLEYLFWAGAELILTDIDGERLARYGAKYRAQIIDPKDFLSTKCHILVPCAMGGLFHSRSISQLCCEGIAGAANNQLEKDEDADLLQKRGILYAPDFVVNAGGLLNVAEELEKEGYNPVKSRYKTHHILDTLTAIYQIAEKNRESTQKAAISLAEHRIQYGIGKRTTPPVFPG